MLVKSNFVFAHHLRIHHAGVKITKAPVVIIGAGIGGLVSAALLSARGERVVVVEKERSCGGKIRQVDVDGSDIDAGPTVFTMLPVFEEIFEDAGASLRDHVKLQRANVLASHAWDGTQQLDLFADLERSIAAVGEFAGANAAAGLRSFYAEAKRIHDILDRPFLKASKTYPPGLMWRIGLWRIGALLAIRPYESLWKVLGEHFEDQRLRQLFARYTTYCGSSPFQTPATLMLIAHVESEGVWEIDGGMSALARALQKVAEKNGAEVRFGRNVDQIGIARGRADHVQLDNGERIAASSVICNADPAAIGAGLLGPSAMRAVRPMPPSKRSLSAMVWTAKSKTNGPALKLHNVFFSNDYVREFEELKAGHLPTDPTAYVCSLDHGKQLPNDAGDQRLQIIVNAPANGDTHIYTAEEKEKCTSAMLNRLRTCGVSLDDPLPSKLTTPNDFSTLFPGTGGALYGRASHGWAASFLRPGCRTRIPGLYCVGGATHPGAGVPMAALSGRLASEAALSDRISTRASGPMAIAGGMSMPSARTAPMD